MFRYGVLEGGETKDEMEQALRIIRQYGFSRICFVGRPGPSMVYFRTDEASASGSGPLVEQPSTGGAYVKVAFPNGGETLKAGLFCDLLWQASGVERVSLFLVAVSASDTGHEISQLPIATDVVNTGTYRYCVPIHHNSHFDLRYRLRVVSGELRDDSDQPFAIYPVIDLRVTHPEIKIIGKTRKLRARFNICNYGLDTINRKVVTHIRVKLEPSGALHKQAVVDDVNILPGRPYSLQGTAKPPHRHR